ncbi:adenylyltransferase/cytidyltransferase family protein [bacterium]|nr:adenylyltransferase/cytidyltransferase family protein [bacterium]MBO6094674.1 adenylyltransferase/cytidyltransferase family protein [bacterium]MBO7043065.1 adenylyltransferase/cytidyltransferase family protein [bacterium]
MRIVNFAGSFDPIHNGHIEMVKKAFEDLKPDIFYITPISRSFTKTYSTSYAQRAEMIKLAISSLNNDKVKINYCEQDLDEGYSGYKHINDLKNYTNAEELYIVIGADHLADLET